MDIGKESRAATMATAFDDTRKLLKQTRRRDPDMRQGSARAATQ